MEIKLKNLVLRNKEDINLAIEKIKSKNYKITDITSKIFTRNPTLMVHLQHLLYNKQRQVN